MLRLIPFEGPVWRLVSRRLAQSPGAPASAPEGRFHHSGQFAAYASLSAEGAVVAIQRYLADNLPRMLVPMRLNARHVVDVRGQPSASVVWQDIRKSGAPSPTWAFSDAARRIGAQAMLYSSRSRPDLSHVVVFQPGLLTCIGPTTEYHPDNV